MLPSHLLNANNFHEATSKLFKAKDVFHQEPCEENRFVVQECKKLLKAIYVVVGEETIVKKNMQYENTADRCTNKRITE